MKRDAAEDEMFEKVDAVDKVRDDEIQAIYDQTQKDGYFNRLMAWNKPKCLIYVALIGSLITGASQPIFGGVMLSRVLT